MDKREKLARRMCEYHDILADNKGSGCGGLEPEGSVYYLWEYWAKHYVDPMLRFLEEEDGD